MDKELTHEQHRKELSRLNAQIKQYTTEIEKLQNKEGALSPEDRCLISTLEHARDAIATNRMVLNNRKRK
jgi:prefoldin subunit 5